jgi:predicted phosphodiesterase
LKIAALNDVHGNIDALEAVLREVPDDAEIVVGGDVALGPYPSETLERLRALGERVHWLRGNADRELDPSEKGLAPPHLIEWVRERLTHEQISFLHSLPPTVQLGRTLFCHATPRNDVDIFTELTPEERVAPHFAGVDASLVVCGHTHMQFDRTIAGVRVVNAGSVGMSYDDEPGAYWALLDGGRVDLRRTDYELDLGDWPGERPAGSRDEVRAFFESHAVGA